MAIYFLAIVLVTFHWSQTTFAAPVNNNTNKFTGPNPDELSPYFEGDIRSGPRLLERSGIASSRYRWPNKVIPFDGLASFTTQEHTVISEAMKEISAKTCITFRARTTSDKDYIVLHKNPRQGCSSNVGRIGGAQSLNLASGCVYKGIAMHELIHAIGFYHEQSRPDRDQHVKILTQNIQQRTASNFIKEIGTLTYTSYDFGSLMHYSAKAFSKDGRSKTIETIPPNQSIGQRVQMSANDVAKVRKMYSC